MSQLTPEISSVSSLWIRSGCVNVEASAETCPVGAHFKALSKAILVAPSRILEIFFHFISPCRVVHLLHLWFGMSRASFGQYQSIETQSLFLKAESNLSFGCKLLPVLSSVNTTYNITLRHQWPGLLFFLPRVNGIELVH